MPLRLLFLIILASAIRGTGNAETRFFVSTAGTLLEAELVAAAGETITLRRKEDARVLTVSRATLCREDHAYIDAWLAQNPNQARAAPLTSATPATGAKFSLTSTIRSSKSNRGDTFSRTVTISYQATLQSREVKRDLTGAKGILVTLAKDASGGERLYVLQKVEFDISLRAQSKMEHGTPDVSLTYNQDSGNRDGVKEHGCVLIVVDAAGVVQHVDASPTGTEKFVKEIMALTAPCVVDREFRVKADVLLPAGIVLNP